MSDLGTVWFPGPLRIDVQIGSEESDGDICVALDYPPHGWVIPQHSHARESETIHIIEGEYEMTVAGKTSTVGPGATVHVPAGVVHGGQRLDDGPGRRLTVFNPGGMERFFLDVGAPSPDELRSDEELLAAAQKHGWKFEL